MSYLPKKQGGCYVSVAVSVTSLELNDQITSRRPALDRHAKVRYSDVCSFMILLFANFPRPKCAIEQRNCQLRVVFRQKFVPVDQIVSFSNKSWVLLFFHNKNNFRKSSSGREPYFCSCLPSWFESHRKRLGTDSREFNL